MNIAGCVIKDYTNELRHYWLNVWCPSVRLILVQLYDKLKFSFHRVCNGYLCYVAMYLVAVQL